MYLDNAATTKVHPYVKEKMDSVSYANYNAKYYEEAIKVKTVIDNNILEVSNLLNVDKKQLVFTSGATESNNYIIKGLYLKYPNSHFITSEREHKSILSIFEYLRELGADVTVVKSENDVVTFDDIKPHIKDNTVLVSVMAVNNETGIINEFENISKELRERKILFHSDITQAVGKIKLDFNLFDYASLSAHKINGPKGIGLALISKEVKPVPLIHGSSQQDYNRGGTLANELVVGMCECLKLVLNNFEENMKLVESNKATLLKFLDDNLGEDYIINFKTNTVNNIVSIRIEGEINQIFLKDNSDVIAASTGSSCSIGEPSYVLKSHGLTESEVQETIRLSTSLYDEIRF